MLRIKRHAVDRHTRSDLVAFLKSIFRGHAKQVCVVTFLSFLAAVAQIGFAFFLFKLVTEANTNLFGYTLGTSATAVIIAILALFSAVLPFFTQRYIVRSTTNYLAMNVRWFRTALSNTSSRYYILGMGMPRSTLIRLMSSEIRYASLSYASVLRFVLPAFLGLACLALLFTINVVWSAVICLLVLPFLLIGAQIVSSGMARNEELRDAAQSHSRAAAALVTQVIGHFSANRWGSKMAEVNTQSYDLSYVKAYGRRLHLGIYITFLMDLLTFSIVGILGVLILSGKLDLENVTYVLIYGLVMRFALGKLAACLNHSISIVSQLPYYSSYIKTRAALERDGVVVTDDDVTINPKRTPEDQIEDAPASKDTTLKPGRVILVHPDGAGWIAAADYIKNRLPGTEVSLVLRGAVLLSGSYPMLFDDYQATFQLSPKVNALGMLRSLPESSHRLGELEGLTDLSELDFQLEAFTKVTPPAKFLASVSYAMRKGLAKRTVFLSATDYVRLSASEKAWLDGMLNRSHVVLVGANRKVLKSLDDDIMTYEITDGQFNGPMPLRTTVVSASDT